MRVAILSDYPVQALPGFDSSAIKQKPAWWLPPLSLGLAGYSDLDVHWLFTSRVRYFEQPLSFNQQTFHCVSVDERYRVLRAYRPDSRALLVRLNALQPDLVHAWGTETPYPLAALRSKRRFVLSMQGLITHYLRQTPLQPIFRLLSHYERYVFRRTRHATVDTSWGAEIMREWMPQGDIREIVCAVQPHFFSKKWAPERDKPVAMFVGTIDKRKGIMDAVRAFADPRLAKAELWIFGHPYDRFGRDLEKMSGSNVSWRGETSSEEIARLLCRAWCLVLPTRADTCPTVVKEARVIGLPVVTTSRGGQRDFIQDGKNGRIIEPDDVPGLATALASILTDFQRARAMGESDHQQQMEELRPERMGQRFYNLYQELTARGTL